MREKDFIIENNQILNENGPLTKSNNDKDKKFNSGHFEFQNAKLELIGINKPNKLIKIPKIRNNAQLKLQTAEGNKPNSTRSVKNILNELFFNTCESQDILRSNKQYENYNKFTTAIKQNNQSLNRNLDLKIQIGQFKGQNIINSPSMSARYKLERNSISFRSHNKIEATPNNIMNDLLPNSLQQFSSIKKKTSQSRIIDNNNNQITISTTQKSQNKQDLQNRSSLLNTSQMNTQKYLKSINSQSLTQILKRYADEPSNDSNYLSRYKGYFPQQQEEKMPYFNNNIQKSRKTYDFENIDYNLSKKFKFKQDNALLKKQDFNNDPYFQERGSKNFEQSNKKQQFSIQNKYFNELKENSLSPNFRSYNTSNRQSVVISKRNSQLMINEQANQNHAQNTQVIKFGTRELYVPIQTLKNIKTQRKHEESLNSHIQCNNSITERDMTKRKDSYPFKISYDSAENRYSLKNVSETDSQTFIPPIYPNKFIKLDQIQENDNKTNSFYLPTNQALLKFRNSNDFKIDDVDLQAQQKEYQKSPSQQHQTEIDQPETLNKESAEKNLILSSIKNRSNIGNLIKMIEEFPLDCIQNMQNKNDEMYESLKKDIMESSKKFTQQKQLKNENNTTLDKNDLNTKDNLDLSSSHLFKAQNSIEDTLNQQQEHTEQEQEKKTFLDLSFSEQAKQIENETKQFILNKERVAEFMPIRAQKVRKNLDGKAMRTNLAKSLNYLKQLKLKPRELLHNNVFSKKPFEKPNSYNLITACKHNGYIQCQELLTKNKYLVYDYDYVYMTALHWSCKRGYAKLSQLLIDKGADVNALDVLGKPPLYYAAEEGHLDCVRVLLFNQAYPWSTKYINYERFERQYPLILSALLTARKISVLLRMTPYKKRNMVWQNQGIAFNQILV